MSKRDKDFNPKKTWDNRATFPKSSAADRLDFCRKAWAENSHITINAMNQKLMARYGTAARSEQLLTVRSEVLALKKSEQNFNSVIKPTDLPKVRPMEPQLPTTPPFSDGLKDHPIPQPPTPIAKPLVVEPTAAPEEDTSDAVEVEHHKMGSTHSQHDVDMRRGFALLFWRSNPGALNHEVLEAVKDEFGIGISSTILADIKEQYGVGRRHQRRRSPNYRKPAEEPKTEVSTKASDSSSKQDMHTKETAKGPIKAAIQMLLEEIPNLKSLNLKLDEDGKAVVAEFEVYSRAFEAGSIDL